MDLWADLAIILSVLAVAYIAYVVIKKRRSIKVLYKIKDDISSVIENVKIDLFDYEDIYQMELEDETHIYLIKVLNMNPKHELIITNSHKWGINENIKGFKKTIIPDFIPYVSEFINFKKTNDKPIKKLALIYPDCYNIIKYLNESDAEKVTEEKPVDGVYFIKYGNLKSFLKKQ